ncbi:hypothetical protein SAY86_004338 [Trapa natans]|uniref:Uncharacterized protein n=1 Tax=Trapa natans TaxID=22666 RepID=A0AAN7MID8_TRANT|nr:hypothetical protein SAY86_004338 [Trapa natans]
MVGAAGKRGRTEEKTKPSSSAYTEEKLQSFHTGEGTLYDHNIRYEVYTAKGSLHREIQGRKAKSRGRNGMDTG